MSDSHDSHRPPPGSDDVLPSEGSRRLPDGVLAQVEADDNDAALASCGLDEAEFHQAARSALQIRAGAHPHLPPWHVWGIVSAYLFALLAEALILKGWTKLQAGNSYWLRSPDGRYGMVSWGGVCVGSHKTRGCNEHARGSETRNLFQAAAPCLPMDLGPETPPRREDGECAPFVSKIAPDEQPDEFLVLLSQRVRGVMRFELQIVARDGLSEEGFIRGKPTRLRIFLHDLDSGAEFAEGTLVPPPGPESPLEEIEVPMARHGMGRENTAEND